MVGAAPDRRGPALAWGFSAAAHVLVFSALFWPHKAVPPLPETPAPIMVTVVEEPKPQPPGPADAPPGQAGLTPTPAPPAPIHVAAPAPAPRPVAPAKPVRVSEDAATPAPDDMSDVMNESQLAGAASADGAGAGGGGGGGGGDCNTARIVQQALQHDPLVRTAVGDAHRLGKSVMLWNGDWVRSGGQEGKGLSAVREAIIWELAFAPEACRNKRVHGLVLLSLADGNTRFAIGAGDWRWSDLLELSSAH
jgi:hypothetical protein